MEQARQITDFDGPMDLDAVIEERLQEEFGTAKVLAPKPPAPRVIDPFSSEAEDMLRRKLVGAAERLRDALLRAGEEERDILIERVEHSHAELVIRANELVSQAEREADDLIASHKRASLFYGQLVGPRPV